MWWSDFKLHTNIYFFL